MEEDLQTAALIVSLVRVRFVKQLGQWSTSASSCRVLTGPKQKGLERACHAWNGYDYECKTGGVYELCRHQHHRYLLQSYNDGFLAVAA